MTPTPRALDLEAEIKALYESGLSNSEIAQRVSRSVSVVKAHIHSMVVRGILQPRERTAPPELQEFDAQLTELHNQGLKPAAIAERLGKPREVTANRIYQLIRTGRLKKYADGTPGMSIEERRDREAEELRARQAAVRPAAVELPVRPWPADSRWGISPIWAGWSAAD